MGTRSTAAAKKEEPAPTTTPTINEQMAANFRRPDGSADVAKANRMLVDLVGEDQANQLIQGMVQAHQPDGLVEITASTWDLPGWKGKAYVVLAGIGTAALLALAAEGLGRLLDVPQFQVVSMISRWVLGD